MSRAFDIRNALMLARKISPRQNYAIGGAPTAVQEKLLKELGYSPSSGGKFTPSDIAAMAETLSQAPAETLSQAPAQTSNVAQSSTPSATYSPTSAPEQTQTAEPTSQQSTEQPSSLPSTRDLPGFEYSNPATPMALPAEVTQTPSTITPMETEQSREAAQAAQAAAAAALAAQAYDTSTSSSQGAGKFSEQAFGPQGQNANEGQNIITSPQISPFSPPGKIGRAHV